MYSLPAVIPSVDVLSLVAFETLRVSVPTIVEATFGHVTTEVCTERLDSWARNIVHHARITLDIRGKENIDPGASYVIMSNHQSHFDIPVLFHALGVPLRMVAKKELYKIPIMSHAMRVAGFVEIDRSNRSKAIETLRAVRDILPNHLSIWIAPEGTRSKTGELGDFKKGGFYLALDAGLPILPVTVNGTREVLPANGLHVTRGKTVEVVVSPPIDPKAYGHERRTELMEAVRAAIQENLRIS